MTRRLLDKQQESEEEKEKNVQIHQNMVEVYSEFIREIWNKDPESEPKVEAAFIAIRRLIFNKLIFYLDKDELTELIDLFNKEKLPKDRIQLYSKITDIVRRGIDKKHRTTENVVDSYSVPLKELWNAISK